jgi:hypothetical protein
MELRGVAAPRHDLSSTPHRRGAPARTLQQLPRGWRRASMRAIAFRPHWVGDDCDVGMGATGGDSTRAGAPERAGRKSSNMGSSDFIWRLGEDCPRLPRGDRYNRARPAEPVVSHQHRPPRANTANSTASGELMQIDTALPQSAPADGITPSPGDLSRHSPYAEPRALRALYSPWTSCRRNRAREAPRAGCPAHFGKPWTGRRTRRDRRVPTSVMPMVEMAAPPPLRTQSRFACGCGRSGRLAPFAA